MKTLVIHPDDRSTDFLRAIYAGTDWTILNSNTSNSNLKKLIKEHDRIIMLGHGSESGMFGYGKFVIEPKLVYLLRDKECVSIWCNADVFFRKYGLKGLYTGMIISEYEEALYFCLYPFNYDQIVESNKLFAKSISEAIQSNDIANKVLESYYIENNPVVDFNRERIFITENSQFF